MTRTHLRAAGGLAALALAAGLGFAVYRHLRPAPLGPPAVELAGADPLVARAVEAARAAVGADPNSAAAWGKLGSVLAAHDYNVEALVCLARAEELDPAEPRWSYYQGFILAAERPAEAIAPLQRAATRAGREAAPHLRLAEVLLGLDRLGEAEAQFRRLSADHPRVLLGLGLIARRRGDLKGCLAPLEAAAHSPMARRAALGALAEARQELGDAPGAGRAQAEAARLDKDAPWPDPLLADMLELQTGTRPRLNRINSLLHEGRAAEAVALARQVARDDPRSDLPRLALGMALMQARDFPAAERELDEAAARWPGSADAHQMHGFAQASLGQFAAAAVSFRRAIDLNPHHAVAYYQLARCLRELGDRPGARAALADTLRCKPDLVVAHIELAELLLKDGDAAAALPHLRDALRLAPDDERAKKLSEEAQAKAKM